MQQRLPVVLVLQDHSPLDEGAPESGHDKVVGVAAVIDNVLQVDAVSLLKVLEEVLLKSKTKFDRVRRTYFNDEAFCSHLLLIQ